MYAEGAASKCPELRCAESRLHIGRPHIQSVDSNPRCVIGRHTGASDIFAFCTSSQTQGNRSREMVMNRESHPVWSVYDKLRTARLNVKYYSCRLSSAEQLNFAMDLVLLATAPTSAIAGLWFWDTDIGKVVWHIFGVLAAITALFKPLLHLPKKIKDYEGVLSGYRVLEYDLRELKTLVEQKQQYDTSMQTELKKILQREKALVAKTPESKERKKVKSACATEVDAEFPPEAFFVPGG